MMESDVWMVTDNGMPSNDNPIGNTVRLPDGSSVTLDPGAQMMLAWSPSARGFVLTHYGAVFDVVYNADQPLHVDAGCVRIRANYGKFHAALSDDGQVLTVHTHLCRVEVLIDPEAANGAIGESPTNRTVLEPCKRAEFHIGGMWLRIDPQLYMPDDSKSVGSIA